MSADQPRSVVQSCTLHQLPTVAQERIFSLLTERRPRRLIFRPSGEVTLEPKSSVDPLFLLFDLLPRLSPKLMEKLWNTIIVECLPLKGEEHSHDASDTVALLIRLLGAARVSKFRRLRVGFTTSSFLRFDAVVLPFIQTIANLPPARKIEHLPIRLKRLAGICSSEYCARVSVSGLLGLDLIISIASESPRKRKKATASKELANRIVQTIKSVNLRLANQRDQLPRVDFTKSLPPELRQQILDPFVPVHCSDKAIYYNFSRLPGRTLLHVNRQLRHDFLEFMRSRCVFQLSCDRHLTKLREFFELTSYKRLKLLYIGLKRVHARGALFENDMAWLKELIKTSPYGSDLDKARDMIRPFLFEYKSREDKGVPGYITSDYYFRIDGLIPPSIVIIKVHATSSPWLEWAPDFRELVLSAHISNMVGKACDNLKAEAAGEEPSPSTDHELLEKMFKIKSTQSGGTRIIIGEDDGRDDQ